MQISRKPITIEDALRILREWDSTERTVQLSIHFGAGPHVITYYKGKLCIEDETHLNLISQYDHHASVDAKEYKDFFEGETDGKHWVVMKTDDPPPTRPPVVMFRLVEDGEGIPKTVPTAWGVN